MNTNFSKPSELSGRQFLKSSTAASIAGQKITWDQALNSQEDLSPDRYDWDATPPKSEVAIPGVTRFV